jgi:hypothetical protein
VSALGVVAFRLTKFVVVAALMALLFTAIAELPAAATGATVTGVIDDASDSPVSGVSVSLQSSGGSATSTTAADGSYELVVAPGTFTLTFDTQSFGPNAADELFGSATVTVPAGGLVENVTYPTITALNVTVLDGSGNPVSGVNVSDEFGGPDVQSCPRDVWLVGSCVVGATGDGTPMTFSLGESGNGASTNGEFACNTNAAGTCSMSSLLLGAQNVDVHVQSFNGNEDLTVVTGVSKTHSNLTVHLNNFVQITSAGVVKGSVSVFSSQGTLLSQVTSAPIPLGTLPFGQVAVVGGLSYSVSGLTQGATVTVVISLPVGSNPTSVMKDINGKLVSLSSIASFSGNTISLHVTDGALGDSDGKANGTVVDPLIPIALASSVLPAPTHVHATPLPVGRAAAMRRIGSVEVTFKPGVDTGGTIDGYDATCTSIDGARSGSATRSRAEPIIVPTLELRGTYTCVVEAVGPGGRGPLSNVSPPVTVGAPDAPVNVDSIHKSAGVVRVAFESGGTNGSRITSYTATCVSRNGGKLGTSVGSASPMLVRGLSRGSRYSCTVTATNSRGTSQPSKASPRVIA